jgi:hypothetical protein
MRGSYREIREVATLYGYTEYQTPDEEWHPLEEFDPTPDIPYALFAFSKDNNYIARYYNCRCQNCMDNRPWWKWLIR